MTSVAAQKSRRYQVWLESSINDLTAAQISLQNKLYEWCCYQSVQSVEKALKSVIVHAGWKPPKTHKLGVLVSLANKAHGKFGQVKLNFRVLEAYTFISRYPFVYPDQGNRTPHEIIQPKDAETCIKVANDLSQKINEFLSNESNLDTFAPEIQDFYYSVEETQNRINGVVNAIKNSDKIKVKKIILYGSFAREKVTSREKTMDILVVGFTDLSFIERLEYVREITRGGEPIVEPLVYTPDEFDYMINEQGEGFLESALEEGRVLYENN